MEVDVTHRKTEVEHLRMACNMAELGISYTQADLIVRLQEKLNKLKGELTIEDCIGVYHKWKEDWQKYFENQ